MKATSSHSLATTMNKVNEKYGEYFKNMPQALLNWTASDELHNLLLEYKNAFVALRIEYDMFMMDLQDDYSHLTSAYGTMIMHLRQKIEEVITHAMSVFGDENDELDMWDECLQTIHDTVLPLIHTKPADIKDKTTLKTPQTSTSTSTKTTTATQLDDDDMEIPEIIEPADEATDFELLDLDLDSEFQIDDPIPESDDVEVPEIDEPADETSFELIDIQQEDQIESQYDIVSSTDALNMDDVFDLDQLEDDDFEDLTL